MIFKQYSATSKLTRRVPLKQKEWPRGCGHAPMLPLVKALTALRVPLNGMNATAANLLFVQANCQRLPRLGKVDFRLGE